MRRRVVVVGCTLAAVGVTVAAWALRFQIWPRLPQNFVGTYTLRGSFRVAGEPESGTTRSLVISRDGMLSRGSSEQDAASVSFGYVRPGKTVWPACSECYTFASRGCAGSVCRCERDILHLTTIRRSGAPDGEVFACDKFDGDASRP